jgi:hypothetical protein
VAGTPLPQQVPDDCLTFQCDGMGMEEPVANDGEPPPPDSLECTADVCSGGTADYQALTGTTCTVGGNVCNAGECVECLVPTTCPDVSATDCIMPTCSSEGACGTAPGEVGQICAGGGTVCNGAGMCVACNNTADCPDAGECQTKGCAPDGTCAPVNATNGSPCTNGVCNGGVCKILDGEACTAGAQCISGNCPADDGVCCNEPCSGDCRSCGDGTCGNTPLGTDPDDDCPGVNVCNGAGMCGS